MAYESPAERWGLDPYQGFSAGSGSLAAITRWNYDAYRGWLMSKDYADTETGLPPQTEGTSGPSYSYTPGGRLKTRTWLRAGTGAQRIVTTYTYGFDDGVSGNEHGDLMGVAYSNDPVSTPSVTYAYDRRGRRSGVVENGITTSLTHTDAGQPLSESYTGGLLGGFSVNYGYNANLQRSSLGLGGITGTYSLAYGYDNAGRLQTLTEGNSTVTYQYLANSDLVGEVNFAHNSTQRMTTTKQYDRLNRLTSVWSTASGTAAPSLPLGRAYNYNNVSQRARATLSDGSCWVYSYDSLGQVISGKHYWQDGTPVAGQQFEYGFDTIGNRTFAKAGGDASGGGLRQASYTANRLNQYSQRTVPGCVDILGVANPTAAVTVNGSTATRKGDYFSFAQGVDNSGAAQYPTNTVISTYGSTQTNRGPVYVPKTPEVFAYDADGNLTNDGRWAYTWDAENRLVKMAPSGTVTAPSGSRRQLEFAYDHQGRRIWERVTNLETSVGVSNRFLYDGWNLVAILGGQGTGVTNTFVWGNDISGSLQGAGGIGGLLRVTYNGASTTNCFVAYDGNGNVVGLVDGANGGVVAQYEYGPFGEVLRQTGPIAKANPFRFSTKYQDDETDLLYYGYRYYNASTGRWLSRDPLGEHLTPFSSDATLPLNPLYAFCLNDPTVSSDYLGLACWVWFKCVMSGQQSGGPMKSCIYNCVENTSKQRETRAPGMTSCEDLESKLPKPMTRRKIDTIIRCLKCKPTMDKVEAFDESWNPITEDCSRSKCLQDLANTVKGMKATCALLKGPPKVACNATVQAIEAAGRTACDLCKKP